MTSRLQYTMWVAVPFLAALVALTGLRMWLAGDSPAPLESEAVLVPDSSLLAGTMRRFEDGLTTTGPFANLPCTGHCSPLTTTWFDGPCGSTNAFAASGAVHFGG